MVKDHSDSEKGNSFRLAARVLLYATIQKDSGLNDDKDQNPRCECPVPDGPHVLLPAGGGHGGGQLPTSLVQQGGHAGLEARPHLAEQPTQPRRLVQRQNPAKQTGITRSQSVSCQTNRHCT